VDCHPCRRGINMAPEGLGPPGSALGLCSSCSTFTCGFHGARMRSGRFVCLRCDVNHLGRSAGYLAWEKLQEAPGGPGSGDPAETGVALTLMSGTGATTAGQQECCIVEGPSNLGDLLVRNLDEWLADRQDYGEESAGSLRAAVSSRTGDPPLPPTNDDPVVWALRTFWSHNDIRVRELLAAAVVLAWGLRLTQDSVNPMIAGAARMLGIPLQPVGEPRHDQDEPPPTISFPVP
jgi:hypothetical protein